MKNYIVWTYRANSVINTTLDKLWYHCALYGVPYLHVILGHQPRKLFKVSNCYLKKNEQGRFVFYESLSNIFVGRFE